MKYNVGDMILTFEDDKVFSQGIIVQADKLKAKIKWMDSGRISAYHIGDIDMNIRGGSITSITSPYYWKHLPCD